MSINDIVDNNFNCLFHINEKNNKELIITKDKIKIKENQNNIKIKENNGLYVINENNFNKTNDNKTYTNFVESCNSKLTNMIWHNRFLHYDIGNLKEKIGKIDINIKPCKDCNISKITNPPHKQSITKVNAPGDLIYSDILEINKRSIGIDGLNGEKYAIIFVDGFSRKI